MTHLQNFTSSFRFVDELVATRNRVKSHLYQNEKSVPPEPKIFNSASDWSNCEPTNYYISFLLFKQKKTKQQNSDRRSRASVLRACQQRVGYINKSRLSPQSGDARVARLLATLNQELKIVGLIVFGQLNFFWN